MTKPNSVDAASLHPIVPSRQVDYLCDVCQFAECTITNSDAVCDCCGAIGRVVMNGTTCCDGTEGFDIVWTDPETGADYVW